MNIAIQRLSSTGAEKSLRRILKKTSGRDGQGHISTRHRGGRHKRYLRLIDFKRDKFDSIGNVIAIEYDPNRSANIALIEYEDGEKRYILAPVGLKADDKVMSGLRGDIKVGNALPLSSIPIGTEIHNVELYPGRGGKMIKSAGAFALILAKGDKFVDLKLSSKEIRRVPILCMATIGRVSVSEHKATKLKKAGESRHLGRRPTVRGTAQHPAAHPHGGGEGRSGQGMNPKTKWGKPAFGKRTRKRKWSDKFIIERRK